MKGQCLCASVEFELKGPLPNLYQCHCSLCRKASGSSANAALVVLAAQFSWLGGEHCIAEYRTASGFKSHFCKRCGSPLPNPTRNNSAWWVPAGLLEDSEELRLAVHLFVASRARWDLVADGIPHYDEMPDGNRLDELLGPGPMVRATVGGVEGVNFRRMRIEDYDGLMSLWQASDGLLLRAADSRAGIEQYLRRNPGLSFIAREAGAVVGTIMAGHDGRRGYIQHVAVAARLRRRGIASRLIAASLDALARAGIVKAHVHVASSNRSGREFWLRRGFHHRPEIELYSLINADDENA